jgi:hypothetical protein
VGTADTGGLCTLSANASAEVFQTDNAAARGDEVAEEEDATVEKTRVVAKLRGGRVHCGGFGGGCGED